MLKFVKICGVAVATIIGTSVGFFGVNSAEAATCTQNVMNGPNTVEYEYTVNMSDPLTCFAGNLDESSPTLDFNSMTYTRGIDDDGNTESGSPISWATGGDPMDNQGGTGLKNWSIQLASDWVGLVLVELKQSGTYSLADVTGSCDFGLNTCSGTWSVKATPIVGSGSSSENILSHTRAYYKTSVVPLPAAGWMLIAGLGALGVMRRRKMT